MNRNREVEPMKKTIEMNSIVSKALPLVVLALSATILSTGCASKKYSTNEMSMPQSASTAMMDMSAPEQTAQYESGIKADLEKAQWYFKDSGMGSGTSMAGEADYAAQMPEAELENGRYTTPSAPESPQGHQKRKIIQNGVVSMETDRFDSVTEEIRLMTEALGGYVENSDMKEYSRYQGKSRRYYNIMLRIPAERFAEAKRYVEGLGKVISAVESSEDVSAQYYDMQTRLETRKIEEERVLDMIKRTSKVEDLLALEQRLGEIRADIESYTASMSRIDSLSSYSTLTVNVNEVEQVVLNVASEGLGGRMYESFIKSVNKTLAVLADITVFLVSCAIPTVLLLLLVAIAVALWKIARRIKE